MRVKICKSGMQTTNLACQYQLYKFSLSSGAGIALEAYYPVSEKSWAFSECAPISVNTLDLKEKIIIRVNMDLLFYHVLYSQRILA